MVTPGNVSEKDRLSERFYKYLNDLLDWLENNKVLTFVFVLVIVFVFGWLIHTGRIKKMGPLEFNSVKKEMRRFKKIDRCITSLPAPKPNDNGEILPDDVVSILGSIEANKKCCFLLKCDNRKQALDIGARLYDKIEREKLCNHIGWINYKKYDDNRPTIDVCLDKEICAFGDLEDFNIKRSKILDLFANSKKHTVLFVDIEEYDETNDTDLERYGNFKGLSLILISKVEIAGFETITINDREGEESCPQIV